MWGALPCTWHAVGPSGMGAFDIHPYQRATFSTGDNCSRGKEFKIALRDKGVAFWDRKGVGCRDFPGSGDSAGKLTQGQCQGVCKIKASGPNEACG